MPAESPPYQLIVWDFDGTLIDSLHQALQVYNCMAAKHGFKPVSDSDSVRGMTRQQFLLEHGVPTWRLPGLFRVFLKELRKNIAAIPPHHGVMDCVEEISARDIRQVIVSSNNDTNIWRWLEHNHLQNHFESVIGYSRLFGKEKPIRKQVLSSGFSTGQVVYIGDEVSDIEAANQVGIDIASVTWGLSSRTLLESHSPDYLIDDPGDLRRVYRGD